MVRMVVKFAQPSISLCKLRELAGFVVWEAVHASCITESDNVPSGQ